MKDEIAIFWFRRDLRIEDNTGLWHALNSGYKVLPLFIYDSNILNKLESDDISISFLKKTLTALNKSLLKAGSGLVTLHGKPIEVLAQLMTNYNIKALYFNRDYEPYAIRRDTEITDWFNSQGIACFSYKDQVFFEMSEVTKNDGKPYTVYTPYSSKWLSQFQTDFTKEVPSSKLLNNCLKFNDNRFVSIESLGFTSHDIIIKPIRLDELQISRYDRTRDFPSLEGTSFLGPHLRFGTISIREVFRRTSEINIVFTKELIWREFFMQILFHFPKVEDQSFRPIYYRIVWLNNEEDFNKWCEGKTGFPLIDAGMRELKETGYMHNRVRMVVANFLTRHLLTDWRWGEAWFAKKLLDFDLSANNGNWQWAAGTGCDAAPYFRIFNPEIQIKKFDPQYLYIKKWIPEFGTPDYPSPIIEHSYARDRAIKYYREGIRAL
jgi:deoxyribodipyrimidine photo-lyase